MKEKSKDSVNAPLINEGGETVVAIIDKEYKKRWPDSGSDHRYDGFSAGVVFGYHHRDTQVTTLQTALAEANNKIAELERRLTPNNHE